MSGPLKEVLLREIFEAAHAYEPGIDHRRPTLAAVGSTPGFARARAARERGRDAVERLAARAGFTKRHFDAAAVADSLAGVLDLLPGLERTYGRLADEASRRALVDVLKLRVLGPFHTRLRVRPEDFRERQARFDARARTEAGTFRVSDPWFSPLSRYDLAMPDGSQIRLHAHTVDLVAVYDLQQYVYAGAERVAVSPGDVVLDIGGCWGDTALFFANLVGPTGRVYTFEFDPESLHILRANLALNPELAERIEIVENALWDVSDETLEFTPAGRCTQLTGGQAPRPMPSDRPPFCVTSVTVDDFVARTGLERVDFVKMDVEGAELKVLAGARDTVNEAGPALAIAAYHQADDLITIPDAVGESGRDYAMYLASYSPVEDETVLFGRARSSSSRS